MSDRVAIFIDGGYTENIGRSADLRIDYEKLADAAFRHISARNEGPTNLLRTYYFDCLPYQSSSPTEDERLRLSRKRKFFHKLQTFPSFSVQLGRLIRIQTAAGSAYQQKGVDLMIGLEIVSLSVKNQIGHACLFSGDGDLVPAIRKAQSEGVKVWLGYSPDGRFASELHQEADERLILDKGFLDQVKRDGPGAVARRSD